MNTLDRLNELERKLDTIIQGIRALNVRIDKSTKILDQWEAAGVPETRQRIHSPVIYCDVYQPFSDPSSLTKEE